jgi:hypothetical protein
MKTKIYYSLILILVFSACSKEEDAIPQTDSLPSISISKPIEQMVVNLGEKIYIEGIATDTEGLSSVQFSIESPYASYNYTASGSTFMSGTQEDFNTGFLIPTNASVGEAKLSVYSLDSDNNQSSIVTRKIVIEDEIPPVITMIKDTVGVNDIIEVQAFKNSNNVVDSLLIINQTRSENLATVTDVGGFRTFNFDINIRELVTNFQSSYTHQFNTSSGTIPYMSFHEYDGTGVSLKFFLY